VYLMVVERVRVRNQGRAPEERMGLPGVSTIGRRVKAAGTTGVLRRRPGPGERRAGAGVGPGPRVARPLERVELDHTPLDLIVVDEADRLPIGRPTVTLALDVYSGLPTGVHVGFEAAGYGAAMRCLLHAILPKEDVRARYGTTHPWPVYGLPETLVVDRAPHLVGGDLGDACGQLGIHLDPSPAKHPWFKGAIERQFRTHNTGLVHGLPGTTFSNVLERGEYDSAGMACISLTRFREILHVYLLDVYGQDWNRGVGGVPATRWAEAVAGGWAPALHHDAAEVRVLLGRAAVRTIQRAGIDHLCLRYQSAALDELRRALPAGAAGGDGGGAQVRPGGPGGVACAGARAGAGQRRRGVAAGASGGPGVRGGPVAVEASGDPGVRAAHHGAGGGRGGAGGGEGAHPGAGGGGVPANAARATADGRGALPGGGGGGAGGGAAGARRPGRGGSGRRCGDVNAGGGGGDVGHRGNAGGAGVGGDVRAAARRGAGTRAVAVRGRWR